MKVQTFLTAGTADVRNYPHLSQIIGTQLKM